MSASPKALARHAVRQSMGRLARPGRPLEPPILISSTRRSGSTLLMEMICTQRGMWYADQPLDPWGVHPDRERLPTHRRGVYAPGPTSDDADRILGYLRDVGDLRTRVRGPWRVWTREFPLRVRRVVIKELNAKSLLPRMVDEGGFRCVYLLRHPIACALSVIRRGWGSVLPAYLESDWFREAVLGADRARACDEVARNGSDLDRYVLEWGLDNYVPLTMERRPFTITFEEIVTLPKPTCRAIAERLELADADRMRQRVHQPSRTSQPKASEEVRSSGPARRAASWSNRVSEPEAGRAMAPLVDVLGLDAYAADDNVPAPSYRLAAPAGAPP